MSFFLSPESNLIDCEYISAGNPTVNMKNKTSSITKKTLLTIVWRKSKLCCWPTRNLNLEKYFKSLKLLFNLDLTFISISPREVYK